MAGTTQSDDYFRLGAKTILALSMLFVIFCFVGATPSPAKVKIYYFEEKVKQADLIVLGTVLKVQRRLFASNTAIIGPEEVLKGENESDRLGVRFGNSFINTKRHKNRFIPDRTYILFLARDKYEFRILGGYQGHYVITKDGYVCYGGQKTRLENFIINVNKVLEGSPSDPEIY